jgi:hypothetical protein
VRIQYIACAHDEQKNEYRTHGCRSHERPNKEQWVVRPRRRCRDEARNNDYLVAYGAQQISRAAKQSKWRFVTHNARQRAALQLAAFA